MQFSTEYFLHGTRYTTVIYAPTLFLAKGIAESRGLGETLIDERLPAPEFPSDLVVDFRWNDAIHSACWLGMIACKAGVMGGIELLDDQGLIHVLSHLARQGENAFLNISDKLAYLIVVAYFAAAKAENKTPGFMRDPSEVYFRYGFGRMSALMDQVKLAYPDWYAENQLRL